MRQEKPSPVIHIAALPIAANVCQQELREVVKLPDGTGSMADVIMQPGATSLKHFHEKMTEVYDIHEGHGELLVGDTMYPVSAESVIPIPINTPHLLRNTGEGTLRHRVWAFPAFDPNDVFVIEE